MTHLNGPTTQSIGQTVIVNNIPHIVLEAVTDRQGELLAVARPRGRRVYLARRLDPADWTMITGRRHAVILATLGWR